MTDIHIKQKYDDVSNVDKVLNIVGNSDIYLRK